VRQRGVEIAQRVRALCALEEVLGEVHAQRAVQRRRLDYNDAVLRLQGRSDRGVVRLPQRLEQGAVERLLDLVMVEHEAPPGGADEAVALLDPSEALHRRHRREPGGPRDEERVKLEPTARRHVEQVALVVVEVGDPRVHKIQHRRRDLEVADDAGRHPSAVVLTRDELPLAEAADDLEDEERVAFRCPSAMCIFEPADPFPRSFEPRPRPRATT
jgi:hypothetical protein